MMVWNFVMAHEALLAALLVAALDLAMALSPSLESNGLLHALYLLAKKESAPPAP